MVEFEIGEKVYVVIMTENGHKVKHAELKAFKNTINMSWFEVEFDKGVNVPMSKNKVFKTKEEAYDSFTEFDL